MVQCCGSPQVDIHYYSPAAFVGVCRNCKAKIRNENPGFPLEIKTGQNLVGDEGMIQMIQDLTRGLILQRSGSIRTRLTRGGLLIKQMIDSQYTITQRPLMLSRSHQTVELRFGREAPDS